MNKDREKDSKKTTMVFCRRSPVHGSHASTIVDSSDDALDEMLTGYHSVITGHRKREVHKVVSRSRVSSEPEIREINKTRF